MEHIIKLLDKIADEMKFVPVGDTNETVGKSFETQVFEALKKKLPDFCGSNKIEEFFTGNEIKKIKEQLKDSQRLVFDLNAVNEFPGVYLPGNIIILSPFPGNPPDILIFFNEKFLPVECKTSKNGIPNFNDSYPKWGWHYLLANTKRNSIIHFTVLSHPEYDPVFLKIKDQYVTAYNEMRSYLKKTKYIINGNPTKYVCRSRVTYKISSELK